MEMTTPVFSEPAEEGSRMQFVMEERFRGERGPGSSEGMLGPECTHGGARGALIRGMRERVLGNLCVYYGEQRRGAVHPTSGI